MKFITTLIMDNNFMVNVVTEDYDLRTQDGLHNFQQHVREEYQVESAILLFCMELTDGKPRYLVSNTGLSNKEMHPSVAWLVQYEDGIKQLFLAEPTLTIEQVIKIVKNMNNKKFIISPIDNAIFTVESTIARYTGSNVTVDQDLNIIC